MACTATTFWRRVPGLAAATLAALGGLSVDASANDTVAVRYTLKPDAALRTAELEVCTAPGTRLIPGVARIRPKVLWSSPEGCRGYAIDLSAVSLAQGLRWRVLWVGAMLPRPAVPVSRLAGMLHVVVPTQAGGELAWQFLGPWPQTAAGDFVLNASAFERRGRMWVGHSPVQTLLVGDTAFRVTAPEQTLSETALTTWFKHTGAAVASLAGGRFPLKAAQVVLLPEAGASVGFGMVERGGGAGVFLHVGRHISAGTLKADWTPYHEFSHLLLPPVSDAVWFAEGYASYAQQVARARAGALTSAEAAAALADGFKRGATQIDGSSLAEASGAMDDRGDYWRVYWGGAAFFLELDATLRRTGGSLDALVARWGSLARPDGGSVPLARFLALADRLHPEIKIHEIAQKHLDAKVFLPVGALLAGLVADGTWGSICAVPAGLETPEGTGGEAHAAPAITPPE